MSLAQKAGKAGALLLLRKMWGALVNIGVMAYLARTLDMQDFGLVAISGTLIGFIQVFGVSGIGEYIIFYNKDDHGQVTNAAFWLNLVISALIVIAVLIVAPFWADFYHDRRIFNLVCLLLVGFFFSMISSIPQALFKKSLDYQPLIVIQTIFGTASQLSQVAFAFLGFGVYSLALPNAVIMPMLALTLLWRSGFRPKLKQLYIQHWKKIFSYTKHVIGARVLSKFANEGDTLLIGKLLGMGALGVYDIAFKLANLLNGQLLPIITNISMPVFAKNKTDLLTVKKHYIKMIELIGFIFIPFFAGLAIFASDIIHLLYGSKWEEAIVPFQILCGFAVFRSLSSPTSGLFNALGKPHIGFYFTAIFTPLFLGTLYFSSLSGLIGACISVTVLRQLGSCFLLYMGNKMIDSSLLEVWDTIKTPVVATLISTFFVVPFYAFFHQTLLSFSMFLLLFFAVVWVFFRASLMRVLSMLSSMNPLNS